MALIDVIKYKSHIGDFGAVPFGGIYDDTLSSTTFAPDELQITVESDPIAEQLADIAVMRSEIAQNPQPGDEDILTLLAYDEIVLRSGMDPEYISEITRVYPEMPEVVAAAVLSHPEVIEVLDTDDPAFTLDTLRQVPTEFLDHLAAQQAHDILRALALGEVPVHDERTDYAVAA